MASNTNDATSLKEVFANFAKFGEGAKSAGTTITLKNADKWMKQANVFTKSLTTTDTGITFSKFKVKQMDLPTFRKYVEDLCKNKKINMDEFVAKLLSCGDPGTGTATKPAKLAVTDRLTDTKKYTGAHKERFDVDGKGKGIEGRCDRDPDDGYVQGYKEKDTYDAAAAKK